MSKKSDVVSQNEASKKNKTAKADVALQSSLRETTLQEKNAHTTEIAELQEQLTAKSTKLYELCAKNGKLADELSRIKTQNAAGGTGSDNLKSVAGIFERP